MRSRENIQWRFFVIKIWYSNINNKWTDKNLFRFLYGSLHIRWGCLSLIDIFECSGNWCDIPDWRAVDYWISSMFTLSMSWSQFQGQSPLLLSLPPWEIDISILGDRYFHHCHIPTLLTLYSYEYLLLSISTANLFWFISHIYYFLYGTFHSLENIRRKTPMFLISLQLILWNWIHKASV